MTAVSAVLSSGGSKASAKTNPPPVTDYISFQIPKSNGTSTTNTNNSNKSPRKVFNFKNSINNNNSPMKGTTAASKGIIMLDSATAASATSNTMTAVTGLKSNCDVIQPRSTVTSAKIGNSTVSRNAGNSSTIPKNTAATHIAQRKSITNSSSSASSSSSPSSSLVTKGPQSKLQGQGKQQVPSSIKITFAVDLNFQQQQQQRSKTGSNIIAGRAATLAPIAPSIINNNNNNSTTLNKNHLVGSGTGVSTSTTTTTDLKLSKIQQPYVKITNIKGVSSTTKNGTKSFILHGEGQNNQVISVSSNDEQLMKKKGSLPIPVHLQLTATTAPDLVRNTGSVTTSQSLTKVLAAKTLISPLCCSSSSSSSGIPVNEPNASQDETDRPTSPKKPRLTSIPPLSPKKSSISQDPKTSKTDPKSSSSNEKGNKTVGSTTSRVTSPPIKSKQVTPAAITVSKSTSEDSSRGIVILDKVRNRKRKLTCCSPTGGGSCSGEDKQQRQLVSSETSNLLVESSSSVSVSSISFSNGSSSQKSCSSLSASSFSAGGSGDSANTRLLSEAPLPSRTNAECLWKNCCTNDNFGRNLNLLDHIQVRILENSFLSL
jgi:hypothetical protein